MAQQFLERVLHRAIEMPEAVALRELDGEQRTMTYGELGRCAGALAQRLETMVGDRPVVVISFANQLEFATALLGVSAAGGTAFPIHPRLTTNERRAAARDSLAVAVIGTADAVADLEPLSLRDIPSADLAPPQQTATNFRDARSSLRAAEAKLLLQSSGTTGAPKIVERRAPALDAVARNVAASARLSPQDRVLGLVPSCHSYGVESVILGPLWAGATTYLCRGIDAVLHSRGPDTSDKAAATVLPGVPAMFEMLAPAWALDEPAPPALCGLRCVFSAGATLPRSVFDGFERRFGVRIGQLYGMTEIGAVTFNDPDAKGFDPASVGSPMADVSIKVVDPETRRLDRPLAPGGEGEIAVAAPSMLSGYLRVDGPWAGAPSQQSTRLDHEGMHDGFFLTGDLGFLDEAGRLTVTGRRKLVVDIGGLKVNLLEVEQALRAHHAIDECVVTPVSVSETVSRLKAYVVPRNGRADLAFDELRAFLRPRLSAHKIPRLFEIRDSFPRSPTGKLLRHKL